MARSRSKSGGGVVGVVVAVIALLVMAGKGSAVFDHLPSSLPTLPVGTSAGGSPGKGSTGGGPGGNSGSKGPQPQTGPSPQVARADLAKLSVTPTRPPARPSTYRRSQFGTAWADVDRNGCNTRDDVLYQWVVRSKPFTAAKQRRCTHDMLAGTWVDPYNGATLRFTDLKQQKQSQALQIDHMVPLAEGWRSGADKWTPARRLAFANDPENLTPVTGSANASKGDLDPAAWKPKGAYQCTYAARFIGIKTKYQLSIDPPEKKALTQMIATCK